jgi:hypothetical protein
LEDGYGRGGSARKSHWRLERSVTRHKAYEDFTPPSGQAVVIIYGSWSTMVKIQLSKIDNPEEMWKVLAARMEALSTTVGRFTLFRNCWISLINWLYHQSHSGRGTQEPPLHNLSINTPFTVNTEEEAVGWLSSMKRTFPREGSALPEVVQSVQLRNAHHRDCWRNDKDSTNCVPDADRGSTSCYFYGENGHIRRDCRVKGTRDVLYYGGTETEETEEMEETEVKEETEETETETETDSEETEKDKNETDTTDKEVMIKETG